MADASIKQLKAILEKDDMAIRRKFEKLCDEPGINILPQKGRVSGLGKVTAELIGLWRSWCGEALIREKL